MLTPGGSYKPQFGLSGGYKAKCVILSPSAPPLPSRCLRRRASTGAPPSPLPLPPSTPPHCLQACDGVGEALRLLILSRRSCRRGQALRAARRRAADAAAAQQMDRALPADAGVAAHHGARAWAEQHGKHLLHECDAAVPREHARPAAVPGLAGGACAPCAEGAAGAAAVHACTGSARLRRGAGAPLARGAEVLQPAPSTPPPPQHSRSCTLDPCVLCWLER